MKYRIGDLIKCMSHLDKQPNIGIIIKVLPPPHPGALRVDIYNVLREDGKIETYTSASINLLHSNIEE
jgi:hypothetical protein